MSVLRLQQQHPGKTQLQSAPSEGSSCWGTCIEHVPCMPYSAQAFGGLPAKRVFVLVIGLIVIPHPFAVLANGLHAGLGTAHAR